MHSCPYQLQTQNQLFAQMFIYIFFNNSSNATFALTHVHVTQALDIHCLRMFLAVVANAAAGVTRRLTTYGTYDIVAMESIKLLFVCVAVL